MHGFGPLPRASSWCATATTLEPATEETAAICERLLELGVIVQPTGDHLNILKIKPPLCIDRASADFFADTLDRAFTELGHRGESVVA